MVSKSYLFKLSGLIIILLSPFLWSARSTVSAATLTSVKDTITTSRPSPASPLSADAASGAVQLSIYNNGSRFLASDSARFINTTSGNTVGNAVTIASQSADLTTIFLPSTAGTSTFTPNGPAVLIDPITSVHQIQFATVNAIPIGGKIVITFPGSGSNIASPSATTFSFNGLNGSVTNIKANFSAGSAACTFTAAAPVITCTTSTAIVTAGTTVTILIGCTTAGTSCSTANQVPTVINPTKTAAAGTGDQWKVLIQTQDASSNLIDSAKAAIATIDSVVVQAVVDSYLTFTIGGVANGSQVNTGNTTGCTISSSETTNTGIASTATIVDLGTLANTPSATSTQISNEAAQLLTITTNAKNGYALTATASGQLINPETGFFVNSVTSPAVFPNAKPFFGIHPCGLDVSATTWVGGGANQTCGSYITGSGGTECWYAWPTQTTSLTLASTTTGPIGNTVTAGSGLVTVLYGAGVDPTVPAGSYRSAITYVATGTF